MNIVDFTIDDYTNYKDKLSLTLYTQGCNLKCHNCFNYNEINSNNLIDEDEILSKINKMHKGIVILGGEPTIQKDLLQFCIKIKTNYPDIKIKLFTNGMNPSIVSRLNSLNLIDSYSVDLKAVYDFEKVIGVNKQDYLETFEKTILNIFINEVNFEVRTTKLSVLSNEHIADIKDYILTLSDKIDKKIKHIFQDEIEFNKTDK